MTETEFVNSTNLASIRNAKNIMLTIVETPELMGCDLDLVITMIRKMEARLHKTIDVDEGEKEDSVSEDFTSNSESDEQQNESSSITTNVVSKQQLSESTIP